MKKETEIGHFSSHFQDTALCGGTKSSGIVSPSTPISITEGTEILRKQTEKRNGPFLTCAAPKERLALILKFTQIFFTQWRKCFAEERKGNLRVCVCASDQRERVHVLARKRNSLSVVPTAVVEIEDGGCVLQNILFRICRIEENKKPNRMDPAFRFLC